MLCEKLSSEDTCLGDSLLWAIAGLENFGMITLSMLLKVGER